MEEEKEGLRLYCFNNMYLSGAQSGIQSLHTTAELFVKYLPFEHKCSDVLYDWANNHKTVIVLNGGMSKDLQELKRFLSANSTTKENHFPWAYFNESEEALSCALTNVGIVVPERVYSTISIPQEVTYAFYKLNYEAYGETELTEFEFELNKRIKRCRLMN